MSTGTVMRKSRQFMSKTPASDAKIVRLWMGNTSDNLVDVTGNTDIGSGIVVPAGGSELKTITLNWPNSLASMWESNKVYHFKLSQKSVRKSTLLQERHHNPTINFLNFIRELLISFSS